jgi:hypothetical protein
MFGAILTAVQTALMNITLPRMEYVGEGLLADEFESGEEIQLQFVIDKLKVVDQPSHEQTQLKLKELLVYTPFLLYTSTKNSDEEVILFSHLFHLLIFAGLFFQYSILIDPASDLIDLISDYAECIVGENKNFHLLNISSSRGLEPSLVQEISTIALKRYRTVLNTLKKLHL